MSGLIQDVQVFRGRDGDGGPRRLLGRGRTRPHLPGWAAPRVEHGGYLLDEQMKTRDHDAAIRERPQRGLTHVPVERLLRAVADEQASADGRLVAGQLTGDGQVSEVAAV